jgi:hypothetical protein
VTAWRARHAHPVDPVAWCVVEALARRAAAHGGEARSLMMRRIEALLAGHAAAHPVDGLAAASADRPAAPCTALAGLSELVDRLGRSPDSAALAPGASPAPPRSGATGRTEATRAALSHAAAPAPLKSLAAFKSTWSRLRAEQRLRQALAQVPPRAGPMNSSQVMNRALQAMHTLSPAYLDAFMAHVDTLLWLEQASGGGASTARTKMPADSRRKPASRAARKA